MKKNAILGLIAAALMFPSCNKNDSDSDSASTATETGTTAPAKTPEEIDAARAESVKESLSAGERRQEFITAFQDPSSKIYAEAAEHVKTLKKMASEDPVVFRRLLDQVNSLRFSRGLTELTAETLTGAALKEAVVVVAEPEAIAAAPIVAACIRARMGAGAPAGAGGAAGGWKPGQACPNNCVCSAAAFVAAGFGVGQATAQCASGETVTAFAYAYAYAAAYAFAYACAPEAPAGPVCGDPAPQPDECLGVDPGADPLVPYVAEPDCLNSGKCGEPVPVVPADTGSGIDTGTGPGTDTTTTDVSTNPNTETASDTGTGAGSGTEINGKLPVN